MEGEKEEWRPVVGFEGWYEVSNLGNIKRVKAACGARPGKVLKTPRNKLGYPQVFFSVLNHYSGHSVHRLVAAAFIGSPPVGKPFVNHIDGNKANNKAANLEYVSHAENTAHSIRLGLTFQGSRCFGAKITEDDVRQIRALRGQMVPREVGRKFGIAGDTVRSIWYRKTWRHVA